MLVLATARVADAASGPGGTGPFAPFADLEDVVRVPLAPLSGLLRRPKTIPLVDCAFCHHAVPARSNSLRRHLRECPACSDEARQFCTPFFRCPRRVTEARC